MLVWTRVTLFDKGFFWYKQDCLLFQRKIATKNQKKGSIDDENSVGRSNISKVIE